MDVHVDVARRDLDEEHREGIPIGCELAAVRVEDGVAEGARRDVPTVDVGREVFAARPGRLRGGDEAGDTVNGRVGVRITRFPLHVHHRVRDLAAIDREDGRPEVTVPLRRERLPSVVFQRDGDAGVRERAGDDRIHAVELGGGPLEGTSCGRGVL